MSLIYFTLRYPFSSRPYQIIMPLDFGGHYVYAVLGTKLIF